MANSLEKHYRSKLQGGMPPVEVVLTQDVNKKIVKTPKLTSKKTVMTPGQPLTGPATTPSSSLAMVKKTSPLPPTSSEPHLKPVRAPTTTTTTGNGPAAAGASSAAASMAHTPVKTQPLPDGSMLTPVSGVTAKGDAALPTAVMSAGGAATTPVPGAAMVRAGSGKVGTRRESGHHPKRYTDWLRV